MNDFETLVKVFDKSKTPYKYKKEKYKKGEGHLETLWVMEKDHGCQHHHSWYFKFNNGELIESGLGEGC